MQVPCASNDDDAYNHKKKKSELWYYLFPKLGVSKEGAHTAAKYTSKWLGVGGRPLSWVELLHDNLCLIGH